MESNGRGKASNGHLNKGASQERLRERAKYDCKYYQEEYWKEDLTDRAGNRGLSYDDPDHSKRFSYLADALRTHFDFLSFLDAGCGTGLLTRIMASDHAPTVGFDVSLAGLSFLGLESDALFVVAGVEAIPFKRNTFDLVFCSDVMEHVPSSDVPRACVELSRVTKKHLVLTINLDNPYFYHPTILPREEWVSLFLDTGVLFHSPCRESELQRKLQQRHTEYECFVFRKEH